MNEKGPERAKKKRSERAKKARECQKQRERARKEREKAKKSQKGPEKAKCHPIFLRIFFEQNHGFFLKQDCD